MRRPLAAAVVLCLAAIGCRRDRPYTVERVEIAASSALQRVGLKASRADLEAAVSSRLAANGFSLHDGAGGKPAPEGAIRLTLEVPLAQAEPAKVGAVLQIRRRAESTTSRYEVEALGEAPSVQAALEAAIEQALRKAKLQLQAADKPDGALVKDLASKDAAVRDSAVRVLADRRHPAVVQALLDRLGGDDPAEVRRAIGALVEMKEARAVPPLIDLANGRDPIFLREVIYALGGIGGEEAQAYLYTVSQGHDQPAIREAAQQALDELSRSEQKPDPGLSSREGGPERH